MKKIIINHKFTSYCKSIWNYDREDVSRGSLYLALCRYGTINLSLFLMRKLAFEAARNLWLCEMTPGPEYGLTIINPQSEDIQKKLCLELNSWEQNGEKENIIPLSPEEQKGW